MSTTYAIFRKELEPPEDAESGWWPKDLSEGDDYTIIGYTAYFKTDVKALVDHLPNTTPIYAIDNGTRLKTLGELKQYYSTRSYAIH